MSDSTPKASPPAERLPLHRRVGRIALLVDRYGVDGLMNSLGFLVFAAAEGLRALHNGKIQPALLVAMALLVFTIIMVALGVPGLFRMGFLPGGAAC